MNKLILLNEVREDKVKNKNKLLTFNSNKNIQKDYNNSYVTFKEKLDYFKNNEEIRHSNYEKNLNKIMGRIFSLSNNKLTIEFINFIYNDELSINTKLQYIKNKESANNNEVISLKNPNYNLAILAEDEYKKFEYEIQFQVKDDQNIAIIISKIDLSNNYNIVSINKKKRKYKNNNMANSKESYAECLIMLNSNIEVPDEYEVKSDIDGKHIDYKANIIKSWKYDFKQLFEGNMYLLFPLKALDIRKRLLSMSEDLISKDLIKDEIFRFFKDMNKYLKKGRDVNLITDKDINELNLITIDLLNNFVRDKNGIFVNIRKDIEATLKDIVV